MSTCYVSGTLSCSVKECWMRPTRFLPSEYFLTWQEWALRRWLISKLTKQNVYLGHWIFPPWFEVVFTPHHALYCEFSWNMVCVSLQRKLWPLYWVYPWDQCSATATWSSWQQNSISEATLLESPFQHSEVETPVSIEIEDPESNQLNIHGTSQPIGSPALPTWTSFSFFSCSRGWGQFLLLACVSLCISTPYSSPN
jgi:hypothetical protein